MVSNVKKTMVMKKFFVLISLLSIPFVFMALADGVQITDLIPIGVCVISGVSAGILYKKGY